MGLLFSFFVSRPIFSSCCFGYVEQYILLSIAVSIVALCLCIEHNANHETDTVCLI